MEYGPYKFSVALTLAIALSLFAYSCGVVRTVQTESKIADYYRAAEKIRVGDPKNKILSLLPDQTSLRGWGRPKESTIIDGKIVEIYYFRTARVPDGKTTDDELVPYLFIDDTLHAIGWTTVRAFTNPK